MVRTSGPGQSNPFDEDWDWDDEEDEAPYIPYRIRSQAERQRAWQEVPAETETAGFLRRWWRQLVSGVCTIPVTIALILLEYNGPSQTLEGSRPVDFGHFLLEMLVVVAFFYTACFTSLRNFPIESGVGIAGAYALYACGVLQGSPGAILGFPPVLGLLCGLGLFVSRVFIVYTWQEHIAPHFRR